MIRHFFAAFLLYLISIFSVPSVLAENNIIQKPSHRKLSVTRKYEIPVQAGKVSVAKIPALMSFRGATNWQVIKSSKFKYSQEPNSIEITADNLGEYRRYYKLTWNSPEADKITVEQKMEVQLVYYNKLYTKAKLPYSEDVKKRFADSLMIDKKEGIDPNNPELGPICDKIVSDSQDAKDIVEGVCDWINENIKFEKGQRTSNEALKQRQGSCTPMSRLACAMLRRIGIPSEMVSAKFIDSQSGHAFIEVYFPDAGWVFYDLSNHTRGFKSLDCLMTVGWCYQSGTPEKMEWTDGYFCTEKDVTPFVDESKAVSRPNRKNTKIKSSSNIAGVDYVRAEPPPIVKVRQQPLRELIVDLKIPPGPRDCNDNQ